MYSTHWATQMLLTLLIQMTKHNEGESFLSTATVQVSQLVCEGISSYDFYENIPLHNM